MIDNTTDTEIINDLQDNIICIFSEDHILLITGFLLISVF